jgi:hypothetical protein
MKRLRGALVVAAGALAAAFVAGTAAPASADYGAGAMYQVEITANQSGLEGGGVCSGSNSLPLPARPAAAVAITPAQTAATGMAPRATAAT